MAVLIMGLSDVGFCVFSLGSICVGLMSLVLKLYVDSREVLCFTSTFI